MGIRSLPTTTDTARRLASFSNASEFSNQSGSVTGYSPCFPQPALIKILGRRVYIYKSFGETRPLSPQARVCRDKAHLLSRKKYACRDKTFVSTTRVRRDKNHTCGNSRQRYPLSSWDLPSSPVPPAISIITSRPTSPGSV